MWMVILYLIRYTLDLTLHRLITPWDVLSLPLMKIMGMVVLNLIRLLYMGSILIWLLWYGTQCNACTCSAILCPLGGLSPAVHIYLVGCFFYCCRGCLSCPTNIISLSSNKEIQPLEMTWPLMIPLKMKYWSSAKAAMFGNSISNSHLLAKYAIAEPDLVTECSLLVKYFCALVLILLPSWVISVFVVNPCIPTQIPVEDLKLPSGITLRGEWVC